MRISHSSKFVFGTLIAFALFSIFTTQTSAQQQCTSLGGTCQNTSASCAGGSYRAGLCPGGANIQCCIKSGSTGPGGASGSGSTFGTGGSQTITIPNPLGATSFEELIVRLNRWLLVIAAPILTLMIVIGAFQILTGAGEPDKITKGRHTITYAIIGYALLLLSSGIVFIIRQVLGVQ
jgi:hypothetical protein